MDEHIQVQGIQNLDQSPFISNQQTIAHEPNRFIIDFKSIYTQFTPDNQPTAVVNHRVILIDPFDVKEFLKALRDNIEKYEKRFGEIKKTDQLIKAEKELKENIKHVTTASSKPQYMG